MTTAVDNMGEAGRCEFHNTVITLTSHSTLENNGEDPPPLNHDVQEDHDVHIPHDYAVVPYIDEHSRNTLSSTDKRITSLIIEKHRLPEEV